jgi:hypothetical protein
VLSLVILAACGGDDDGGTNEGGGEFPDGPAAEVAGVWEGSFQSEAGGRSGMFCAELEQDGRELNGIVVFDADAALTIGGIIANQRISWVWSPTVPASDAPEQTPSFTTGGTFSGDVDTEGDHGSGSWTSLSADHGTWTGARTERGSCD